MRKIWTYTLLFSATLLLTGFSWGFGSNDPCKSALELAGTLEGIRDDAKARQAEATILSLCPDGGAATLCRGSADGACRQHRRRYQ